MRFNFGFASFRGRILALVIGLIALVQITTMLAMLAATRRNVAQQQREALAVGGRVVEQRLQAREKQLLDRVEILTADYAFREAMTSADRGTLAAVLENHGERAGANLVALVGLDGRLLAGSAPGSDALRPGALAPAPIDALVRRASSAGSAAEAVLFAGRLYQLVLLPVEAPQRIAWIGMGFTIDDALAHELARLTALDVSFLGALPGAEPQLFGSSLDPETRPRVAPTLVLQDGAGAEPTALVVGDQLTVALPLSDLPGSRLRVVLQSSIAAAFAPWHEMRAQQVGLTAVALVLSALLAVALGRRVTQPVNTLVAAARRILGGDYGAAIEVRSRDELGLLARTFNEMQGAIAEREHRIVHQASHDALTDLPNRTIAQQRIAEALVATRASKHALALVALDLRGLKNINDGFGYAAGDGVLVEFAARLREAASAARLVARLGSDEFLVALDGVAQSGVEEAVRRLVRRVQIPFAFDDARLELAVHAGAALCPTHGDDANTLLRRADIALQDAKSLRKDLVFYENGRDERHLRQLALMRDLRLAIAGSALSLHFQPKIDLLTGQLSQAEALARWTHPERGPIPPDEFVPLAERAGSIFDLTRWVLDQTARQWRAWTDRGLHLGLAVNLSAQDLGRAELPGLVHGLLAAYAMPPQALILELTESAVMQDPAAAKEMLQGLRDAGLRVAIDDFGTGHSSLSQLKQMPVDELKIDKSFMHGLKQTSEDAAIVRSIVDIGHHLGLQVVAEGVEDRSTWEFLLASRCDMAQGFYISRPLAPDAFEAFALDFATPGR